MECQYSSGAKHGALVGVISGEILLADDGAVWEPMASQNQRDFFTPIRMR
jgi:hypothetical protein